MTVTAQQATQRAIAAFRRGAWAEAEALCRQALAADAESFDALHLLGTLAARSRRIEEAAALFGRAASVAPANVDAHVSHGNALCAIGRLPDALGAFDRALALAPDYAEVAFNRGNVLKQLGRAAEALASYDRALALKPALAEAAYNSGVLQDELARWDAALESFDRAVTARPDFAAAHFSRGHVLRRLGRIADALASYDRALALQPGFAEAWNNRGNVLKDLERFDEAADSYGRAVQAKPGFAEAWNNRGAALEKLKRPDEALACYDRVLALKPDLPFLRGFRVHTRMTLCDWRGLDGEVADLAARIERGEKAAPPFPLLALVDALPLQRRAAEIWAADRNPPDATLPPIATGSGHPRIRVGYFSADFREHPVSQLMAGVFESHDRSRFECTAFSFGPDTGDAMRRRLEAAFDAFVDVRDRSDAEIVALARAREIDIAVDLGGYTFGSRAGILAARAAPLQIGYLGYLGTMGVATIDYLVADATIVPPEHRPHYAEKIVYLPCYQANDTKRAAPPRAPTRAELRLPESGFVFCCSNNSYKITPDVFDGWMRILGRVDGSVLLLYADNRWAAANLAREAAARGVDPARLVFGSRLAPLDYLARLRAADLFLDTSPYNAGTTASDALWVGLPVLTRLGQTFAGRVAASVLRAAGLPELVTTAQDEYEATAVALAADPRRLGRIRQTLEVNRATAPLFDTAGFTRHLEDAYTRMHARRLAGLPPDHIVVPA